MASWLQSVKQTLGYIEARPADDARRRTSGQPTEIQLTKHRDQLSAKYSELAAERLAILEEIKREEDLAKKAIAEEDDDEATMHVEKLESHRLRRQRTTKTMQEISDTMNTIDTNLMAFKLSEAHEQAAAVSHLTANVEKRLKDSDAKVKTSDRTRDRVDLFFEEKTMSQKARDDTSQARLAAFKERLEEERALAKMSTLPSAPTTHPAEVPDLFEKLAEENSDSVYKPPAIRMPRGEKIRQ